MESKGIILVVDDDLNSLQMMMKTLTAENFEVRPANSGALALSAMVMQLPDLILLDIRMPGMDGFEVCRRLKADDRTRDIPVLFLSAVTEQQDRVKGFMIGAVDYIGKPFDWEELLARINTHLGLRRLRLRLEELVTVRTEELKREKASALEMTNLLEEFQSRDAKGIAAARRDGSKKSGTTTSKPQPTLAEQPEQSLRPTLSEEKIRDLFPQVSRREAQVAWLLYHGLTALEIAEKLFISIRTVEWHVEKLYLKLAVRNKREAILRLIQKREQRES